MTRYNPRLKIKYKNQILTTVTILFALIFFWGGLPLSLLNINDSIKNYPFYPPAKFPDCHRLLENITSQNSLANNWPPNIENEYGLYKIFSDCKSIKRRYFYRSTAATEEEAQFPLAYAILVNEDLAQVELLLNAIYEPQNTYCIHIDLKSSLLFAEALRRYISCFPNVIMAGEQYLVTPHGTMMAEAVMSCFQTLQNVNGYWKYVFILQGHDFPLRTNLELVRITRDILRGMNTVGLETSDYDWLPAQYPFFVNEEGLVTDLDIEREPFIRSLLLKGNLQLKKGPIRSSLSRPFIDYILASDTTSELLEFIRHGDNWYKFFLATLNYNSDEFPAPGTSPGMWKNSSRIDVMSYVEHDSMDQDNKICQGHWRNSLCIFSESDMPRVFKKPEMFLNNLLIRKYPGTVYCMHELHFNKTNLPDQYPSREFGYDPEFYKRFEPLRYREWSESNPGVPI